MKNGGSKQIEPWNAVYGGNVKNAGKLQTLGALAFLSAGLWVSGCKSAPDLSQSDALAMIQAKYDQTAPVNTDIVVNDLGMREGVTAKYWEGIKKYPNGYWADFKLTDDGKKLVKLPNGGDVILWHPDGPSDPNYAVTMTTVAANHLKARDIEDVEDNGNGKTVAFVADVNLEGLPAPLQGIAHNPGNTLAIRHHADFALANGVWALQSVE
ncbi:MAG: hypothetical protein WBE72_05215 [Terracidiphilus sp.]